MRSDRPHQYLNKQSAPEGANGEAGLVRQQHRDGAVQSEVGLGQVLEHVQVVHAVRLCFLLQTYGSTVWLVEN